MEHKFKIYLKFMKLCCSQLTSTKDHFCVNTVHSCTFWLTRMETIQIGSSKPPSLSCNQFHLENNVKKINENTVNKSEDEIFTEVDMGTISDFRVTSNSNLKIIGNFC